MFRRNAILAAVLTVAWCPTPTRAGKAPSPPPTESGVINGQAALMLWPDDGQPLASCEAHLMPLDHQDTEYKFGCGEWFLPPARGSYKMWMERPSSISPTQTIFTYQGGSSPRGGTIVRLPLGPAGDIALAAPRRDGTSLHAANLDTYLAGAMLAQEFDRRVKANQVQDVKMPVGRILAGVFDMQTNDAIAIAKPAVLAAGRLLYVNPQPPSKGADVFAVLRRPRLRSTSKDDVVDVKLECKDMARGPDAIADDAAFIIAAWYAVPAGTAMLRVSSEHLQFSQQIVLRERQVATVRGAIQKLPSVRVAVETSLKSVPPMRVSILDGAYRSIREGIVHDLRATIDGVTSAAARVRLEGPEFLLEQPLDLSSGNDADVTFKLSPFTVHGTLYRGDDVTPGEIEFVARGKTRRTSTDAEGRYTIDLWSPAYYAVRVRSPDIPQTTARVHLFDHDEAFDIRLPITRCTAVLRSKATGHPAPDTTVVVMNRYKSEGGQDLTDREEVVSDSNGIAKLPPLHPGSADITVVAHKEYREYRHTFTVLPTADEQTFNLELESEDAQRKASIRWPDGTPAADVALQLWNPQMPLAILWRGTTDAAGEASLPLSSGTVLLARHQRGSAVFPSPQGDQPVELRLAPVTTPLFVKCISIRTGPQPIEIALWINGVRLTGAAVAFMAGSGFLTNGAWSATFLPAADLRLLAFHPRLESAVLAGQYDALATAISLPPQETLSIRVVE